MPTRVDNLPAKPKLETATVAFADAMGTSFRSEEPARAQRFLGILHEALESGQRFMHGKHLAHGIRSNWFSDAICVSAPQGGWKGVATVCQSMAVVAAAFALKGVFLRGALTIDLHYQEGMVAFGPGLTASAKAEAREAIFPRIILMEPAREAVLPMPEGIEIPLAEDLGDGQVFVDFIRYLDDHLEELALSITEAFREAEELPLMEEQKRVIDRLQWLSDYFQDNTGRSPFALDDASKTPPGRFRVIEG